MGLRGRTAFDRQASTFFITTTFVNFTRILAIGKPYSYILRDSLIFVLEKYSAKLFAYVFMPSHIHLVIYVPDGKTISSLMRDFKKYTSTRIRQQLETDDRTDLVDELRRNAAGRKQVFKLWMDRFDDVVIKSDRIMRIKVNYIHQNPVRAGLVQKGEDWPYSSARFYGGGKDDFMPVVSGWER